MYLSEHTICFLILLFSLLSALKVAVYHMLNYETTCKYAEISRKCQQDILECDYDKTC